MAEVGYSAPISSQEDLTPEHQAALQRVRRDKDNASKSRSEYEKRWAEWYGLHRNYRRYAEAARDTDDPGRDEIRNEMKREYGAELFIPYVFAVIETKTPRLLMNNPKMKVKPRAKALSRERAEAVRLMFEERQADTDFVLRMIPIVRQGLKYGLGIGKNFWDRQERSSLALETGGGESGDRIKRLKARVTGQPQVYPRVDVNDGPRIEDVEILDFFWDPGAKNMETCRYAIHRTWRDERYVRERIEKREWFPVDIDAVKRMSAETNRGSVFRERAEASGLTGEDIHSGEWHEVWEWHDGERVITVLDGSLVVQDGQSPFSHGELPFTIFRPTLQENEFVGIGEIEPIVHLQHELNAMRSMRLDNAMLVMQKAFLYAEGLVDPADLVVGPGKGIPVQAGDIDSAIKPLNFGELPNAGYQEEAAIKNDIELASAMNETIAGSGAASETATGEQLVQAAANVRLELTTKMMAHELVKRSSRQWLELFRQNTLTSPREVLIETPEGYEFISVTGEDLDLVRAVEPEEDSMAPENMAQKRNDSLALYNQTRGNEVVDQRKAMRYLLNAFDVTDAESWILPEQTQLNPQVAMVVGEAIKNTLAEAGMDEEQADELALAAVGEAMEGAGISAPPAKNENGAGPVPAGQQEQ